MKNQPGYQTTAADGNCNSTVEVCVDNNFQFFAKINLVKKLFVHGSTFENKNLNILHTLALISL